MSHSYPSDISREQFARILPTLESARRRTKPRIVDLYDVFCGVLYLLKSGCQNAAGGLPRLAHLLPAAGASSPTRSSIPFWNKS